MTGTNDHSSRAHALLSASASERWMHCPASARLAAMYPRQDTAFTLEGTQAHEVAEAFTRRRVLHESFSGPSGIDAPADMKEHAEAYADYIESMCNEHTMVLLEQRLDMTPWIPEGFGTADCILMNGTTMNVIDFKYGQGVEVSAVGNTQMMLYALGAINEYGFIFDIDTVRMHIFQPRKDNISVYELSVDELRKFGETVKIGAAEALSEHPKMAAGTHCKFCPHAGHCPELAKTCIDAVTDYNGEIAPDPNTLSPTALAVILDLEPMISAWLKKIKDTVLEDLQAGVSIPGYKVVEGKLGNRKWSDEMKVVDALRASGYSLEDITTTSLLSPAAMDKAIGKKVVAELLADLIDRAPGAPTVAPEKDKRPAISTIDDFKNFN